MTPRRPGGAGAFPDRVEPASTAPADPAQLYAALDLGTNSCRMLIARPSGNQFHVIDSFSKAVQLGHGLEASGRLSRASMARTVPEVGAWTAVHIGPSAAAITSPFSTVCPGSTTQRAMARALWRNGKIRWAGIGAIRIGTLADSSLWESGLTPPLKLKSLEIMQSAGVGPRDTSISRYPPFPESAP